MMLFALLFVAAISPYAFSNECPELGGSYGCVLSDTEGGGYSVLKIDQTLLSGPGQSALVQYSFDYSDIEGPADVINASLRGEIDSYGWTTSCENGKLISFSDEVGGTSEIYLIRESDHTLSLIQTMNGKITSSCPKLTH